MKPNLFIPLAWAITVFTLSLAGCGPPAEKVATPASTQAAADDLPQPTPPSEGPEPTKIKGFNLGMTRQAAKDAATANGWDFWEEGAEALAGIGEPTCMQTAVRDTTFLMDLGDCKLRAYLQFDGNDALKSMTFGRASFDAEEMPREAFVQALLDQYDIPEVTSSPLGDMGCTQLQGATRSEEWVKITRCATVTITIVPGSGGGNFN